MSSIYIRKKFSTMLPHESTDCLRVVTSHMIEPKNIKKENIIITTMYVKLMYIILDICDMIKLNQSFVGNIDCKI